MNKYVIESPHTAEECQRAQEEMSAGPRGTELLNKTYFGCHFGVHKGWAIVDANSETDAKNMLPDFLRSKATVAQVSQLTPEEIKGLHKPAMAAK